MTETRKAIIELIEPFMNKTLNKGCFVNLCIYLPDEGGAGVNLIPHYNICEYLGEKIEFTYYNSNKNRGNIGFFGADFEKQIFMDLENYTIDDSKSLQYHSDNGTYGYKIIGHYDITAVLKYLDGYLTATYPTHISFLDKNKEYRIPMKPLHLYTEQEEKDLLELLLKLK